MKNWQFFLMMMTAVIVWGCAFPLITIGLKELSFINLTIMRFLVVCVVFILLIILKFNWFSKLHKKDIIPIFFLGFLGVIVYHFGLNYGQQNNVSPGAASLIIATIPVLILILASIFLKEKITRVKFLGIIFALFGVVIISLWGKENTSLEIEYIVAALAVFLAAIMAAIYTIVGKKMLNRYNGISLTAYALLLGSLGLIPFVSGSLISEVGSLSFNGWFAVFFLGIFSTVIGYGIWYIALKIKNASEISIYLYAVPVIATIVSYFVLYDKITIFFILGGAFVFLGLLLVNKRMKKLIKES